MWEKNINKHEEEEETHKYVVVIFSSILYLINYFIRNFFKRIFILLHVMFFYNKVPCFPTLHYSTNY